PLGVWSDPASRVPHMARGAVTPLMYPGAAVRFRLLRGPATTCRQIGPWRSGRISWSKSANRVVRSALRTPADRPLGGRTTMQRAVVLEPYQAMWPADDPNADFRSKVAEYSRLDPLPTL